LTLLSIASFFMFPILRFRFFSSKSNPHFRFRIRPRQLFFHLNDNLKLFVIFCSHSQNSSLSFVACTKKPNTFIQGTLTLYCTSLYFSVFPKDLDVALLNHKALISISSFPFMRRLKSTSNSNRAQLTTRNQMIYFENCASSVKGNSFCRVNKQFSYRKKRCVVLLFISGCCFTIST
jgi:hypothetical protein